MKSVILYTAATPNGQKVSNFTEELKQAYPGELEVEYRPISLGKNEQKEKWFLKINPNGCIPALVDPNRKHFAIFETASILLYLEKHYDPKHIFSWSSQGDGVDKRSEILNWLFFIHGGLGPMQGQANHFIRYAPEDVPYGKNRYLHEIKRLYSVLATRLKDHDWLVGDKYSLADINAYPWMQSSCWSGLKDQDVPQCIKDYIKRNYTRTAVQKGMREPGGENDFLDQTRDTDFFEKYADEANKASAWIQQGMTEDRESESKV